MELEGGADLLRGVFVTSYLVLWVIVAVLVILVLLLYRQMGLILMPGRQRISLGGLDLGGVAPALGIRFVNRDRSPTIDWRPYRGESPPAAWAVLFATPACPICKGLLDDGGLAAVADSYPEVEFVWLDSQPLPEDVRPEGWSVAMDSEGSASVAMEVPGFPFLYVIDSRGHVAAKGIVNTADEVGTLVSRGLGDRPLSQERLVAKM
jgi:hypothetical protein